MLEKETPLALALTENLRLRLMLSSLPDPVPDSDWGPRYVEWWFRNCKRLRTLGAALPDNVA